MGTFSRRISVFLLAGALVASLQAQDAPASGLVSPFAMTMVPALALVSPTTQVLRPSTVQALGASAGQFFDPSTGSVALPDAYAAEFSPALVFFGDAVTLPDYQKSAWLYRTDLSVATAKEVSDGSHSVSVGIRTNILDGSDLRENREFLQRLTEIDTKINNIFADSEVKNGLGNLTLSAEDSARVDALKKMITTLPQSYSQGWTKPSLQWAAAVSSSVASVSPLSISFRSVASWLDYQIDLVPGKVALVTELMHLYSPPGNRNQTSAATSLSVGTNEVKLVLDGRAGFDWQSNGPSLGTTGNLEFKVPSTSFWAELNGGVEWDAKSGQFLGSGGVNFRTSLS